MTIFFFKKKAIRIDNPYDGKKIKKKSHTAIRMTNFFFKKKAIWIVNPYENFFFKKKAYELSIRMT